MSKRKTVEDYHSLAASRGFKWIENKLPYLVTEKTDWVCDKGHIWNVAFSVVKGKRASCYHCAVEARRKTKDEYHSLAKQRGCKWLGPEVNGVHQKTNWRCGRGHLLRKSFHAVQTKGCLLCSKLSPKTVKDYHELARQRNFKWLGPFVEKVTLKTWWECQGGHKIERSYNRLRNCPFCTGKYRRTQKDYKQLARIKNIKWLGPPVEYTSIPTWWECKKGHQWRATYSNIHNRDSNCPYCNESKGEKKVARCLDRLNILYTRQKRFRRCKHINMLPFDFYFDVGGKQFLIEYDGKLHFSVPDEWGGEEALQKTRLRDAIKTQFAKDNGFTLIRIPYTERDIKQRLQSELARYIKC